MKTIPVTEARQGLLPILRKLEKGDENYQITKHGRVVAVFLSLEEYRRLKAVAGVRCSKVIQSQYKNSMRELNKESSNLVKEWKSYQFLNSDSSEPPPLLKHKKKRKEIKMRK